MKNLLRPEYLLSILSGILFVLPFLSEHLSLIAWISLVPLFFSLRANPDKAFRTGIVFGTVACCLGHYWLVGTLTRFGGFSIWVSSVFIFIYCLYIGAQYALFTYLSSKARLIQSDKVTDLLIICSLWTALEHFYPSLFPYGFGNTQAYNLKVIQVSDLLGVPFLSFIMVFVNLTAFLIIKAAFKGGKKPVLAASLSVVLITFLIIYGLVRIEQTGLKVAKASKINIGVVQANFDFFERILDNSGRIIKEHKQMSEMVSSADLIIWPEASVMRSIPLESRYLEFPGPEKIIPEIEGTYFLIGGIGHDEQSGRGPQSIQYNTAFLANWNGEILGRYNKNKLLLFGEYMPFADLISWEKYLSAAEDGFISPGTTLNLLNVREKGIKIGTLICYEDLIAEFSRRFSLKGANILINLTNDAWFGRSSAPYQHLLVSIPRAVETRRYLIRATNTGVSAVVTPTGEVRNKTEIFKKEVFTDQVALLYSSTLYMKIGDVFPWGCLILFVLFVFNKHLKRRYGGENVQKP